MNGLRVTWGSVIPLSLRSFSESNGTIVAGGIAYFALLSLFPLALAVVSIVGFISSDRADQDRVVDAIYQLIPVSRGYLSETVSIIVSSRGPVGVIGIVGLIWGGLTLSSSIRKSVNQAWLVTIPYNLIKGTIADILILAGLAVTSLGILAFSTVILELSFVREWVYEVDSDRRLTIVAISASFLISTALLTLIYKYVPNRYVHWRDVLMPALLAGFLLEAAKNGFSIYVTSFDRFNLIYGSLGALIAILVWIYVSSIILIFFAHVSFRLSRIRAI